MYLNENGMSVWTLADFFRFLEHNNAQERYLSNVAETSTAQELVENPRTQEGFSKFLQEYEIIFPDDLIDGVFTWPDTEVRFWINIQNRWVNFLKHNGILKDPENKWEWSWRLDYEPVF